MKRTFQESVRTVLALAAALAAFGGLYFLLQFNPWISLGLAVAVYVGMFFLLKPIPKIGNVELESLQNGAELQRLLEDGQRHLAEIKRQIPQINDGPIRKEAEQMAETGAKLIRYLEANPDKIGKSRRFLGYHLETAKNTLDDYLNVGRAGLAEDSLGTFRDQTRNIMHLLTHAFHDQFTQLIEDRLMNVDVQNEVLESRINAERKVKL